MKEENIEEKEVKLEEEEEEEEEEEKSLEEVVEKADEGDLLIVQRVLIGF